MLHSMEERLMAISRIRLIAVIIGLIASLLFAINVSAETKTFIKEYTYMTSDIDSKVSSRAIAGHYVLSPLWDQQHLLGETPKVY